MMSRWQKSRRSLYVAAIGALLVASFTACASPPIRTTPTQPGDEPATPAVTPSPVPTTPPAAARILVRSDGLQIVTVAGDVLDAVTYFDPIADVVGKLSAAIGTAPVVEPHDGGIESSSGTYYRWDGLVLNDVDSDAVAPLNPEWFVRADGPAAGALPISTADHVSVGDSEAEVEAVVPGTLSPLTVNQLAVLDGEYDVRTVGEGSDGTPLTHSVFVRLEGVPLTVTVIAAPTGNYGV